MNAHRERVGFQDPEILETIAARVAKTFGRPIEVARKHVGQIAISARHPLPPPAPPTPAITKPPPGAARAMLARVLTRRKGMTIPEILLAAKDDVERQITPALLRAILADGRRRGDYAGEIDQQARVAGQSFMRWRKA